MIYHTNLTIQCQIALYVIRTAYFCLFEVETDRNSVSVSVTVRKLAIFFSFGYGRNREARFRPTFGYGRNYDKVSA